MKWQLTAEEIVQATGAKRLGPASTFSGVSTDSRGDVTGKLFIALKGERFDGHDFIETAIANGASSVLTHQPPLSRPGVAFFQVSDTLKALQDLALFWRRKHKFFVLALSGSNGKTSSKDFTFQILNEFAPTVASQGSLNNHWGVPISILSAGPDCRNLILEMGMNHLGELRELAKIAEPDVTAITMVGPSHIGELGSQENISIAKEELYLAAPQSIAIFNLDNQWTSSMYLRASTVGSHRRLLTFASHKTTCDVSLRACRMTMNGLEVVGIIGGVEGQCLVKVFGRQNVNNLMVAVGLAMAAGMPAASIWKRLPMISATAWGRNQWIRLPSGTDILFDAYNANPSSMAALLRNIYELESTGGKSLILGEMLELGTESSKSHLELGELAGKVGADSIWFMGPHMKEFEEGVRKSGYTGKLYISRDFEAGISSSIRESLGAKDVVAIKASRGQKLERVLENWGLEI